MLQYRFLFIYSCARNLLSVTVAVALLLLPGLIITRDLADLSIRRPGIPDKARRMPRYLGLAFYIGFGRLMLWLSIRDTRKLWREGHPN
jgi:hypothetical protein